MKKREATSNGHLSLGFLCNFSIDFLTFQQALGVAVKPTQELVHGVSWRAYIPHKSTSILVKDHKGWKDIDAEELDEIAILGTQFGRLRLPIRHIDLDKDKLL